MKKIFFLTAAAFFFAGCAKRTDAAEFSPAAIHIAALKGPTGIGMVGLMEEAEKGATDNEYDFEIAASPDKITAALLSGACDIGAVPVNVAALLWNKTDGDVKLLAVNALGSLYLLSRSEIGSAGELNGKRIAAAGKGSSAECALRRVLEENGADAQIEWASEHAEAVSAAVSGDFDAVMLPEPFATQLMEKDASFSVQVDLAAEWEKSCKSLLAMGALAVRSDFAEKNRSAVLRFLDEYEKSVACANGDPSTAAKLCEKFGIMRADVVEKAVPRCKLLSLTGKEMRNAAEPFLKVLAEFDAKSVGGEMPSDEFYFSPE